MPGDRRVALRTLNCHLTCALCSGYMIDASTICACRHTFCRSCLFRYLKRYRRCPICDIKVKRNPGSKPNIRYDNTIQELIFKVVPGLVEKEMILRENFYNKSSDKCKGCNIEKEDDISICLMQCERDNLKNQSSAPKKYLLSPSAFSVRMMKKFIRYKFNVKDKFQISLYSGTMLPLNDTQSMRDVAFDSRWMRTAPLEIRFSLAVPSECVDVIGTRSKHPRINTGLRCSSGKGRSLCGSTWLDGERADCGGRVDVDEGEWLGESSPAATTTGYHSESEPASTFRSAMDPHVAWSHGYDLSPAHRDGHAHPAISDTNPRQRPPLLTPKSEPLYTGYPGCNDNSVNNRQGRTN